MDSLRPHRACHFNSVDSISVRSHSNFRRRAVRLTVSIRTHFWRIRTKSYCHVICSWSNWESWAYARTRVLCALIWRVLCDWNHACIGQLVLNCEFIIEMALQRIIFVFFYFCRGFCMTCASQLQFCPLCRAEIVNVVKEESESPTSDECMTWYGISMQNEDIELNKSGIGKRWPYAISQIESTI